ncbi:deoxyribodipyrimidine photo-lyase/cryptochrome family protein [Ideonella sp. 4Y16]|uniref:Deoxyribodipyrimidine photo-lyase/cryptochrome family protein n=1 Tax=Ideonella alba TaxID=2824118 RepID=A0A941BAK5_9BURK|nr:FAD-binding domain-containing protein [Ideonella alba]MBQ0929910.1 deoxyribodipyrimidine photo-lyase/cryptochrome family protein [Ideonella alba]MBQ0942143.1 deoxyribodipyrimidine photo-lyase/cryptochrome family protein [Ideonella alba]
MSDAAPQLVWFKRDLRVADHAPLAQAAQHGPVVALFVYEPSLLHSAEFDACHLDFINDALAALREALARRGCPLLIRVGECPQVLQDLQASLGFRALWSHEETGLEVTYARDRRVAAWCRAQGIAWHEIPQCGVVRRLRNRDGWAERWAQRMSAPLVAPPVALRTVAALHNLGEVAAQHPIRSAAELGVAGASRPEAQRGGERRGQAVLQSFLRERGVDYRRGMSSPTTGFQACSRLSAHLAWGSLSLRQVHQACEQRRAAIDEARAVGAAVDPRWPASLQSFSSRLRWHCHFMQKLEDEPRIEFENFSHAFDGLREPGAHPERLAAWCAGRTGYPLIDACMRALHSGGWINFRMRAMLVSFAAQHLWLHWRDFAPFLARQFIDFEPGIHYSQVQMQSGTTGINAIRIYSPIKQALDQDPEGVFIRRHVPELAAVPTGFLAQPERMPTALQQRLGVRIGHDYPAPIVDHASAYRAARERIGALRKTPAARTEAERVLARHGSRRSGLPATERRPPRRPRDSGGRAQLSLWGDEPT